MGAVCDDDTLITSPVCSDSLLILFAQHLVIRKKHQRGFRDAVASSPDLASGLSSLPPGAGQVQPPHLPVGAHRCCLGQWVSECAPRPAGPQHLWSFWKCNSQAPLQICCTESLSWGPGTGRTSPGGDSAAHSGVRSPHLGRVSS